MPTFTLPTSTASQLLAQASSLFSDPGMLTVIVLIAGVPFGFWLIKQIIGLIPKSHGRKA